MQPDPEAGYRDGDRANVEGAIDFLSRHGGGDTPLCVFLPLNRPHPAYTVEAEFYGRIDPEKIPARIPAPPPAAGLPPILAALRGEYGIDRLDEHAWREVRRIYYGMCAKVDFLFGRLTDALKQTGIYDDSMIVFLSDHGDFTGDYGLPEKTHATLQDCLLRVPLIIKPPAGVAVAPGVRAGLVELVDMPATVYDLLEIDPEYDLQGRSLRASLAGGEDGYREAVFAEVGARAGEKAFFNLDVLELPPDSFYGMQARAALPAHAQGTYAVMCRTAAFKYIRRAYSGAHELYDLRADPCECRNLAGMPSLAGVEREMERRLLDFFMHTGDVLPRRQDSRAIR